MKRLDRYIFGTMLRIIVTTVILVSFILLLFDIFSNLDQYMNNDIGYLDMGRLTLLYIPEAIGYALGPASLFATTYFLSMLHTNNEMIILSNVGYPYRRIIAPILVLGLILTLFQFGFSEKVAIPASREKILLTKELIGVGQSNDSRNVTLRSPEGNYVLYAGKYNEESQRITSVILVVLDETGRISAKVDAASGTYNGSYWVLDDVTRYLIGEDGNELRSMHEDEYHNQSLSMEPVLFRNLSADITSMELYSALQYVKRIQVMNANQYAAYATDLSDRVFSNLTPLILIIISCSTVFTWRKNVLILSILASLAIAVVYFVMQMLSMIIAKQGIISPIMGPLAPMGVMLLISFGFMLKKRN